MKKMISFSAAVIAVFALLSCGNDSEEWEDNNNGNGNIVKPNPSTSADGWASLADSTTYVLVYNFMDKSRGTFWGSKNDTQHDSQYLYWQQAYAMDTVIWSYLRIKDSNPELARQYEKYMELFFQNGANNYNKDKKNEGEYGRFFNVWTDDMCWIGITLLNMSEATGVEKYAQAAKDVYDKYIWTRRSSCDKGTCLPWTSRVEDKTNFNACTNTPACLLAARLYQKFGGENYLQNAEALYSFNIKNKHDDERVESIALTYTQGTFGEACRLLYNITGDVSYMKEAGKVIKYAFYGSACTKDGLLRHEGENDDQSIFKAGLIPYAVNYVLDPKADKTVAAQIREKLLFNAKTLNKNLRKDEYPNMFANYFWGEKVAERGLVRMGAHCSGAALIEGVARMTAAEN